MPWARAAAAWVPLVCSAYGTTLYGGRVRAVQRTRQTGPRCVAFSGLVGGAAERGGLATLGWVLGAEFREEGRLFRGLEWISFRLWYVRKG